MKWLTKRFFLNCFTVLRHEQNKPLILSETINNKKYGTFLDQHITKNQLSEFDFRLDYISREVNLGLIHHTFLLACGCTMHAKNKLN